MASLDLFGITWTVDDGGAGTFDCPRCRAPRSAARSALQPRLRFGHRPLARLGRARSYVTCDGCGHAFAEAVEDRPAWTGGGRGVLAARGLAEDERALLAVVAAVVFSDSTVRTAEKRAAGAVIRRYIPDLPELAVDDLLRRARPRWGDAVARLERLRHLVGTDVRLRILEAAYHVCTSDGELHRQESRLLDRIGEALDLPPREIRQALVAARRRPPHVAG